MALVVWIATSCGRSPTVGQVDQVASPARTASPTPATSPPPSGQWQSYGDPDYQFSVSYPPGFTFELQHGDSGTTLLMTYRAVDRLYLNSYPPGQIEIAIYTQDASSPIDWVAKHSGPATSTDRSRYWSPVTNTATVSVAGKTGFSYDLVPDGFGTPVHATALFIGTRYVLVLDWWANDATYESTLSGYYVKMRSDLRV
jgi:hypothetical protein